MNDQQVHVSDTLAAPVATPVGYRFLDTDHAIGAPYEQHGAWWDYVVAADGVHIAAEREGLHVRLPLSWHAQPLRGLAPTLMPELRLACGRIPAGDVMRLREAARTPLGEHFRETLFWLGLGPDGQRHWTRPEQTRSYGRVIPAAHDAHDDAVLELHTHPRGVTWWSATDDLDETGLRLYSILEDVDSDGPSLLVRVGVFGHHIPVAASSVFELPAGWHDPVAEALNLAMDEAIAGAKKVVERATDRATQRVARRVQVPE